MPEMVYKEHSIYKWFNPAIFSQNTSISKPKSAQNKPFNENLSKPIPNKTTESCGQKTRYLKSEVIRQEKFLTSTTIYFATFKTQMLKVTFQN